MPKLSFVVIGFNIENYIEKCLNSILNQTITDFEVIFVDDGSMDNTLEIVEKLNSEYNKIKIITQENSGANVARINGYKNCSGEYIIFIDGDDWVANNLLENVYEIINEDKYDIICYNHSYYLSGKVQEDNKINLLDVNKSFIELILSQELPHEFWNKVYRKKFLEQCKFDKIPKITMGDDLVANVHLGVNNPKVKILRESYYFYNQRAGAITKKSSNKNLEILKALNEIEKELKSKNLLEKYKEHLEFLWFYHVYYSRIIAIGYKRTKVEEELYKAWKNKNIKYKNNSIYIKYREKITLKNKIKKQVFDISYSLGNFIFKNK